MNFELRHAGPRKFTAERVGDYAHRGHLLAPAALKGPSLQGPAMTTLKGSCFGGETWKDPTKTPTPKREQTV